MTHKFKVGDKVRNIEPFERNRVFKGVGQVTAIGNYKNDYEIYVHWGEDPSRAVWGFCNPSEFLELVDDLPNDGRKDKWI